jgi:hypothetical protein
MLSKALETGVFFHRGPVLGNMEGMLLSQGLTEKGEIFLSGKLFGGNPRDTRRRLWKCSSVSIGAPLGNLKGGSFTGDFEIR